MHTTNMRSKAIIFDLDGTLLDTLDDLAAAANGVLARNALPGHPREAYRFFVGEGMETLMRRAAPEGLSEAALDALCGQMREEYGANWAVRTKPYPGVDAMLTAVKELGLPLAVLSNKPHALTELTVRHFFPHVPFFRVQGSPPGSRAKPDPALALALARDFGLDPAEVLFVGDSSVDMDTAVAAGMIGAGALWGFRPRGELEEHGARVLLRSPGDVLACL